jgi:16S rRNA G966 N2-methylase RsmD
MIPIDQIKIGERFRKDIGDIASLAKSIRELGLLHPIVVDSDNYLIAGLRRIKAVKMLGWTKIPAYLIPLKELEELVEGEIQENVVRLNFTPLEIDAIRKHFEPKLKVEAEKQQEASLPKEGQKGFQCSGNFPPHKTRDVIGSFVGKSGKTVEKIKEVAEAAEKEPEKYLDLAVEMNSGKRSVDSAFKELKKRRKKEKQLGSQTPFVSDNIPTLIEGKFEEKTKTMADNSIDVIITDPPYGKQYLDQYEKLGEVANRLLKPHGSLLVMTGQSYLPEILNLLRKNLTYNWTIAYLTPGGQSAQLWSRKVNAFWKPIVWFVKDKYEGSWVGDVVKSATNDNEKEFSKWQQSESGINDLVERFTVKNDLILDPFMGSGTTGIVALCLGRRFIGIDSDPEMVKTAKQRMGVLN